MLGIQKSKITKIFLYIYKKLPYKECWKFPKYPVAGGKTMLIENSILNISSIELFSDISTTLDVSSENNDHFNHWSLKRWDRLYFIDFALKRKLIF